uniref:Variant surface glycoprotein 761 n=1 Tax=Trypanosoma brucei TaxID=5691 RepID=M4TAI2_9TRYP|nr:variant surface glycoprotein 761 [Trypanosoma brucei]
MSVAMISVLYLATLPHSTYADDGHAQNLAEMDAICQLIKLAKIGADAAKPVVLNTADIEDIKTINISLADPEWRKGFPSEPTTQQVKPSDCTAEDKRLQCDSAWQEFQKWNIRAAQQEKSDPNKRLPVSATTAPVGRAAAVTIAGIAAQAQQLVDSFVQTHGDATKTVQDKVNKALKLAAYGRNDATGADSEICQAADKGDQENNCKLPTVGSALCVTLVCVCGKNSATQDQDVCGAATTPQVGSWNKDGIKNAFATLAPVCDKAKGTPATSTDILAALRKLKGMVKTTKNGATNAMVLGIKGSSNKCDNTAGTQCADITAAFARKSTETPQDIQWETQLTLAAAELAALEAASLAKKTTETQLEALKKQAEATFVQLLNTKPPAIEAPAVTPQKEIDKAALQELECQGLTKATQCREKGHCKWEGDETDGRKCKLNATAVEQQAIQAGTEGGTTGAVASTGCAKHGTDKAKCGGDKSCK